MFYVTGTWKVPSLYVSDVFLPSPNTFNLHYEGCIFVGLYDTIAASNQVEPYP